VPGVVPPVGQLIGEEGTSLTRRPTLNFIGATVTAADNAASNRTDVTITGSGSTTNITFAANSGLPVYNVKSATYGAVGNGTTDDTSAIQAAITAAQAVGGIVFFPKGDYKITSTLTITAPCTLQGEFSRWGYRTSNRNWDAWGAVIRNASTSADAINYTPASYAAGYSASLNIRDLGVSTTTTPSGTTSTDSAGWGPFSTGTAIKVINYAQHVVIQDCVIARHYTGIDLSGANGGATVKGAFNEVRDSIVAICKTTGIDARGIENRVRGCQVKCNDPEWTSSDANPARGNIGINVTGNSNWATANNVISYEYGFVSQAGTGSYGNQFVDNFADACTYCYYLEDVGGHTLTNNSGTACRWNPAAVTWSQGEAVVYSDNATRPNVITGGTYYRGKYGVYIANGGGHAVTGIAAFTPSPGSAPNDPTFIPIYLAANNVAISGCHLTSFNEAAIKFGVSGTATTTITGNRTAGGTAGTTGSAIFRGNTGITDAG